MYANMQTRPRQILNMFGLILVPEIFIYSAKFDVYLLISIDFADISCYNSVKYSFYVLILFLFCNIIQIMLFILSYEQALNSVSAYGVFLRFDVCQGVCEIFSKSF